MRCYVIKNRSPWIQCSLCSFNTNGKERWFSEGRDGFSFGHERTGMLPLETLQSLFCSPLSWFFDPLWFIGKRIVEVFLSSWVVSCLYYYTDKSVPLLVCFGNDFLLFHIHQKRMHDDLKVFSGFQDWIVTDWLVNLVEFNTDQK